MPNIPIGMMEKEIILKLPVKPLLRMMCLSKFWNKHLNTPDFVKEYFRRSYGFIARYKEVHTDWSYHDSFHSISCDRPEKLISHDSRLLHLDFVSSCKGLICLSAQYWSRIYLWNPSTGEYKSLPSSSERELESDIVAIGFGFVEDDYRVVKVKKVKCEGFTQRKKEVEVYSLRKDCLKSVGFAPRDIVTARSKSAFVNGAVHWLKTRGRKLEIVSIISYNICKNEFGFIKLPDEVGVNFSDIEVLSYRGDLSVAETSSLKKNEVNIWVMQKSDVLENSWNKKFTVVFPVEIRRLVAFCEKGEAVAADWRGNHVYMGDSENEEISKVNVPGHLCEAVSYSPSLVPLGSSNVALTKKATGKRSRTAME